MRERVLAEVASEVPMDHGLPSDHGLDRLLPIVPIDLERCRLG